MKQRRWKKKRWWWWYCCEDEYVERCVWMKVRFLEVRLAAHGPSNWKRWWMASYPFR